MRSRSRYHVRRHFRLIVSGIVVLCAIQVGCEGNNGSRVRIKLEDLPQDKSAAATKPAQMPPLCPPAGIVPLQLGTPGTGDHRVILTWNASTPSRDPGSAAAGYCLYRSKIRYAAKKNPVCKDCEQVNRVPVPTAGCVDDVVTDTTQYYYVVTAINSKSVLSSPSNEIGVLIPSGRKPSRPTALPLCRAGLQPQAR